MSKSVSLKEKKRLLKNKNLREWRTKHKERLNKERRDKYALGKQTGLSVKDATNFRGFGVEHITENYPTVRYREKTKTYYFFKYKIKAKKIEEVLKKDISIIEKKITKRTERRRIARDLGYTPAEANYLRDVSEDKWDNIISNMVIVDSSGRENRWAMMASKDKYDKKIEEACQLINLEAGYEINSRYGWAVYYFWYINGGDIEHWKEYCEPDIFNSDMLGYKGNAGTYLSRLGVKVDKKFKKYEKTLPVSIKYTRKGHAKTKGTVRSYKNVDKGKNKNKPYVSHKSKVS